MMIDTDRIIVDDRIRSDYGNIEELAADIKEQGLINPPLVTPDYHLIAGERRLRAMKQLGWQQIEVRVMNVTDAMHQLKLEISENENRKNFSFSEKMKWAKMLKAEYEGIARANSAANDYGRKSVSRDTLLGRVDKRVAEEVGLGSAMTFSRAKYVEENADPELIKQLDEGQLSINAAYRSLKEKADKLQQQQNDLTTEAAGLATRLEKQVKKNADQEETIAALKRQGDPDLIAQIDKLKDDVRTEYERGQAFKSEAAQARRRAEVAEETARKDRMKVDKASEDMNELLDQIGELEEKLNGQQDSTPEGESLPEGYEEDMHELEQLRIRVTELEAVQKGRDKSPVELIQPSRYTMSTVLQCLISVDGQIISLLDKDTECYFDTAENLDSTYQVIGEIVTKLYALKNKIAKAKGVA